MKFLCVECDEPMQFEETKGPEDSSISITFRCPACGNRITLLTNPGETQLLRSLDVRIGSPQVPPEPMHLVRGALVHQGDEVFGPQEGARHAKEKPTWTEEAEKRLEKVPAFVRDMARKAIERYALEQGCDTITPEVMECARAQRGF